MRLSGTGRKYSTINSEDSNGQKLCTDISGLRLIAVEQGRVIAAAWSGKLKTGCTMVGLSAMMLFSEAAAVNTIFTVLILITTVGSGIHYFWVNRDVFKS